MTRGLDELGGGGAAGNRVLVVDGLVELAAHRSEHALQGAAHALQGADGGDGNQGGDQAVLDGGGAGVVGEELGQGLEFHNILHDVWDGVRAVETNMEARRFFGISRKFQFRSKAIFFGLGGKKGVAEASPWMPGSSPGMT